jgi:hypothetical protein
VGDGGEDEEGGEQQEQHLDQGLTALPHFYMTKSSAQGVKGGGGKPWQNFPAVHKHSQQLQFEEKPSASS